MSGSFYREQILDNASLLVYDPHSYPKILVYKDEHRRVDDHRRGGGKYYAQLIRYNETTKVVLYVTPHLYESPERALLGLLDMTAQMLHDNATAAQNNE